MPFYSTPQSVSSHVGWSAERGKSRRNKLWANINATATRSLPWKGILTPKKSNTTKSNQSHMHVPTYTYGEGEQGCWDVEVDINYGERDIKVGTGITSTTSKFSHSFAIYVDSKIPFNRLWSYVPRLFFDEPQNRRTHIANGCLVVRLSIATYILL